MNDTESLLIWMNEFYKNNFITLIYTKCSYQFVPSYLSVCQSITLSVRIADHWERSRFSLETSGFWSCVIYKLMLCKYLLSILFLSCHSIYQSIYLSIPFSILYISVWLTDNCLRGRFSLGTSDFWPCVMSKLSFVCINYRFNMSELLI